MKASIIKKGSLSRPRFRMSNRSGINLRMHPKGKSYSIPTLGMINSTFEPKRISEVYSLNVSLRSCLKDYYGIQQGKARLIGSTFVRATTKWNIKSIDRRIDIILHRSGLVNSIVQARQLISHGHIKINNIKDFSMVYTVVKPRLIVKKNTIIFIDYNIIPKITNMSTTQWSNWNNGITIYRNVPPYLEVDYINGSVILVNNPCKETILIPAGLGKTLSSSLY